MGPEPDCAKLARRTLVTRSWMTQIISLPRLAADIQEAILFLPRVEWGNDPITLKQVLPVAGVMEWGRQSKRWANRGISSLRPSDPTTT